MAERQSITELLENYVQELKRKGCVRSLTVERAFRLVERHRLLESFYVWPEDGCKDLNPADYIEKHLHLERPDPQLLERVYSDAALITRLDEEGRPTSSTSQPALVAIMLEQLELEPGMNVLEIGAGTGYNAALMAEIVGDPAPVTTIDVQDDVVAQTKRLLKQAGYEGIRVLCRDGAQGDTEGAPYDRVVATVGCPDISWKWAEQLGSQGLMLIPLQHGAPHCDPLVKLHKIEHGHLKGRVVAWSGFMLIQGELSTLDLWPSIDVYQKDLKDRPPDRDYLLFPGLEGARLDQVSYEAGWRAWYDFHYFMALCDPRAYMGISTIGLSDPEGLGVVVITGDGIKLWGDKSLYRDLEHIYERWEVLGRPQLTDWHVEFFLRGKAPDVHANDGETWVIDRLTCRQLAYLA